MSVTISFLWTTCILVWGYANERSLKELFCYQLAFLLVLDLNRITSTAAIVGGQEINCSDLVLISLAFTSFVLLIRRTRIDRHLIALIACLIAAVGLCLLYNVVFPFEGSTIGASGSWDRFYYGFESMTHVGLGFRSLLVILRLALWLLVMCIASAVLLRHDYYFLAHAVVRFCKVQLLWGAVEFITKNLFKSTILTKVAQFFFPSSGSVYLDLNIRGGFASIQGFTREPSHFAMAVFFFLLIELLLSRCMSDHKNEVPWTVLAVVLLLFSGAFTAIVGLVLLLFLAIYFYFESRSALIDKDSNIDVRIVYLLLLVAFLAVALLPVVLDACGNSFYVRKFENVLNNMDALLSRNYSRLGGTSDALPRIISIVDCLFIFCSRPLFGIGPGVVNPFSGIIAALANFGILFTALWYLVIGAYSKKLSGKTGARLFLVLLVLIGLLLFDGDYVYNSCWILLAALFGIAESNHTNVHTFESNKEFLDCSVTVLDEGTQYES